MSSVNRKEFVNALKKLKGIKAVKESLDAYQNFCFITPDKICVYNGTAIGTVKFDSGISEGCYVREDLLNLLNSTKDETVEIKEVDQKMLEITSSDLEGAVLKYEDHRIPKIIEATKVLDSENQYKPLPKLFTEGLTFCMETVSKNLVLKELECVVIRDNHIYSTDNLRISKYALSEDFPDCLLVIKNAFDLTKQQFSEYCFTCNWLHLREGEDFIYSIQCQNDLTRFPNVYRLFDQFESDICYEFPEKFREHIANASKFSEGEYEYQKSITIEIGVDEITIHSQKSNLKCHQKVPFNTKHTDKFEINPIYFSQALKHTNTVHKKDSTLLFDAGALKILLLTM